MNILFKNSLPLFSLSFFSLQGNALNFSNLKTTNSNNSKLNSIEIKLVHYKLVHDLQFFRSVEKPRPKQVVELETEQETGLVFFFKKISRWMNRSNLDKNRLPVGSFEPDVYTDWIDFGFFLFFFISSLNL